MTIEDELEMLLAMGAPRKDAEGIIGMTVALQLAKNHGYTHCLLGHVTCPFNEEGEEAFTAAWYQGRGVGQAEFITGLPLDRMFGSQFEGGM